MGYMKQETADAIIDFVNKYPAYFTLADILAPLCIFLNSLVSEDECKHEGMEVGQMCVHCYETVE